MSQRYPEVSFSMLETYSSNLPELLLKSKIDLAAGILSQGRSDLRVEKLLTGRLLLICSKRAALSARRSISRRELRKLNLIRHSMQNTARGIAYEMYGEAEVKGRFHLEAMNSETIISYVRRNMGVALATSYMIDWLKPAGIATIELEDSIDIPWGVMSDPSRPMSKAATVFIDKLRDRFSTRSTEEPS
jgi:DNA-binding transcriptional LysR family regulator